VVSDDSDRNFDGNGPRTGVVVTFQVGVCGELKDIRWIDGRNNPADAMTMATANASMEQLINTNKLELRVQGWVNRATYRDATMSTT
jgi:hypothetical protein